jgi:hypothetical protein
MIHAMVMNIRYGRVVWRRLREMDSEYRDALKEAERLRAIHTPEEHVATLMSGVDFDPQEPCRSCGYAIGAHVQGGPCPTEEEAWAWWGR